MIRSLVAPALAAGLIASAALADTTTVREVDVDVDLTAVQNEQAAAYYANLSEDLEEAILARVVDRTAEDGVKISIDIDEIELANSFQSAAGLADARLDGSVFVSSENDNTKFNNYDLAITAEQVGLILPAGTTLAEVTNDSAKYYELLVTAYADAVVERL